MQQGKRAGLSGHTSRVQGLQKVIGWDPLLSRTDLKGCRLCLYSPGDHTLQVVVPLKRYTTTRAIPSVGASLHDHSIGAFLMLQTNENLECVVLRRMFAEMTRGVFNFPVDCTTFVDKQCTGEEARQCACSTIN